MAPATGQRRLVLGIALAATLGLTLWQGMQPEEPAAVKTPPGRRNAGEPATAAVGPALERLRIDRPAEPPGAPPAQDLFASQSWFAPPPATPPADAAPPLPFTYFGKLVDDGRVTVYLSDREERNFAVRQGDVIDGTYKVARIAPPHMTIVYLPLNKKLSLDIGRAN